MNSSVLMIRNLRPPAGTKGEILEEVLAKANVIEYNVAIGINPNPIDRVDRDVPRQRRDRRCTPIR